jgi:hypothetical protein
LWVNLYKEWEPIESIQYIYFKYRENFLFSCEFFRQFLKIISNNHRFETPDFGL